MCTVLLNYFKSYFVSQQQRNNCYKHNHAPLPNPNEFCVQRALHSGEYAVHILCDGEDIPQSPYMAQIVPKTDYNPDDVKVYGPGIDEMVIPKQVKFFRLGNISCGKYLVKFCNGTKCLKNQSCDVIKMREIRGEVGKKNSKKEMDNHSFL